MFKQRILIAGIGNIFLGDDGFGVAVVSELAKRTLAPEIRLVDSGIRGRDLAFTLLDGFELVILVDAVQRGEKPGTIFVIEPDENEIALQNVSFDPHKLDPLALLQYAKSLGAAPGKVIVVGCEPAFLDSLNGLSAPVRKAVFEAVRIIESRVAEFLSGTVS